MHAEPLSLEGDPTVAEWLVPNVQRFSFLLSFAIPCSLGEVASGLCYPESGRSTRTGPASPGPVRLIFIAKAFTRIKRPLELRRSAATDSATSGTRTVRAALPKEQSLVSAGPGPLR